MKVRLEESDVRIPMRWVLRGVLAFCLVLILWALIWPETFLR